MIKPSIVESFYESLAGPCGSTMVTIFNAVMVKLLFERPRNIAVDNRIQQVSMAKRKTERGKVPLLVFEDATIDRPIKKNKLSIKKCV